MKRQQRYIIQDREQSAVAESFRALRSSIQATLSGTGIKTILFTSAGTGEGGAMAAANTAASLAYAGKKTVLVDCDLRTPILHEVFGVKSMGVTDIVQHGKPMETMIQKSGINNLAIVASGPAPSKPLEVLSDEKMKLLIDSLKTVADIVILSSSTLSIVSDSIVADACVLASKVESVVLVIDARTVRVTAAKKALALLKGAKANVIGTVLNGVNADKEFIY